MTLTSGPGELRDSAVASANRRYGSYRRAVDDLLAGKPRRDPDKRANLADAAAP
jgi:hypothetical protein